MAKPRGDLGAMVVPKAAAAAAVPHAPASPPDPPPAPAPVLAAATPASRSPDAGAGASKAPTAKLEGATYRRLRRYCQDRENATGRAPTHQEVMVAALLAFLPPEDDG